MEKHGSGNLQQWEAILRWHQHYEVDDILSTHVQDFMQPPATPIQVPQVNREHKQAPSPSNPEQDIKTQPSKLNLRACDSLGALARYMEQIPCGLKHPGNNFVFADGHPDADLMVIGEAPGEQENREQKPFVGRSGLLLDQMLAAIGLSRHEPDPKKAVYITNVVPWRPPGNRKPSTVETELFRESVFRHIALQSPKCILAMGGSAATVLLNESTGITRLRGNLRMMQFDGHHVGVIATFHPAYLLRNPLAKREAYADLRTTQKHLATDNTIAQ